MNSKATPSVSFTLSRRIYGNDFNEIINGDTLVLEKGFRDDNNRHTHSRSHGIVHNNHGDTVQK